MFQTHFDSFLAHFFSYSFREKFFSFFPIHFSFCITFGRFFARSFPATTVWPRQSAHDHASVPARCNAFGEGFAQSILTCQDNSQREQVTTRKPPVFATRLMQHEAHVITAIHEWLRKPSSTWVKSYFYWTAARSQEFSGGKKIQNEFGTCFERFLGLRKNTLVSDNF